MARKILNIHHRFCLRSVGCWPGMGRNYSVAIIYLLMTIFYTSAAWNHLRENYHDLPTLSANIVGTLGAITMLMQLGLLQLKRR